MFVVSVWGVNYRDTEASPGLPSGTVLKNLLQCRRQKRCRLSPRVGKIPWRRKVADHSSIPAWKIPWTEEPGGLQSMGSQSRS